MELPSVMNALLRAEAGVHKLPIPDLEITDRVTDPDGGIDARIKWPSATQHDILSPGLNGLQYKAGKLSRKILEDETSKTDVKRLLKSGGKYILCVGFDYNPKVSRDYASKLNRSWQPAGPVDFEISGSSRIARTQAANPRLHHSKSVEGKQRTFQDGVQSGCQPTGRY
jgi:hypothetical protein